jgi:hypothetical protein
MDHVLISGLSKWPLQNGINEFAHVVCCAGRSAQAAEPLSGQFR